MKSVRSGSSFSLIRATVESELATPSILTISSALAGDGKTAVTAGLARSLASAGYSTLVLDAAARVETVPGIGGEQLTADDAAACVSRAIRSTPSGCDFMALADLGAEVTSAVAVDALFDEVRTRYDYTVVDASVVGSAGLTLARRSNGVVLAVREGRAIDAADTEAVALLSRVNACFLGVVATTDRFGGSDPGASLLERLALRPETTPAIPAVVPVPSLAQRISTSLQRLAPAARLRPRIPARSTTPE